MMHKDCPWGTGIVGYARKGQFALVPTIRIRLTRHYFKLIPRCEHLYNL